MNPGDGADARHRLFQCCAGGRFVAPAALQVEQADHDGEIVGDAVLEFAEEQITLGQLDVMGLRRMCRADAEALRHGDSAGGRDGVDGCRDGLIVDDGGGG